MNILIRGYLIFSSAVAITGIVFFAISSISRFLGIQASILYIISWLSICAQVFNPPLFLVTVALYYVLIVRRKAEFDGYFKAAMVSQGGCLVLATFNLIAIYGVTLLDEKFLKRSN